MAATPTACGFSPAVPSLSPPITNPNKPIWFFRPFSASKKIPTVGLSWSSNRGRNPVCSRISHTAGVAPKRGHVVLAVSGLMSSISETDAELEPNNLNTDRKWFDKTPVTEQKKDATIDIQLPRRSLLVKFTCNLCGERTNRLVNRLAYERGLIYVQCAGCIKYHKLADNLGLVVEYDLREDIDVDTNTDEV